MMRKVWLWGVLIPLIASGCAMRPYHLDQLRQQNARLDKEAMFEDVPPEIPPLTYEQLTVMALKRNLELLARQNEQLIQQEVTLSALNKQLPEFYVRGDFSNRNNEDASSSENVFTRTQSLAPSISTKKWTRHVEYGMALNLLDYGISYYTYRQEYKKHIIAQQQYVRLQQNLLLEVTRSYWKAVVSKMAAMNAKKIVQLIEKRQENLTGQLEQRLVSEFDGLQNERSLVEMKMRMANFEREYKNAKTELASQVGLPPGYPLRLALPKLKIPVVREIPLDMEILEDTALSYRPELVIQDMEEKIRADEIRSSIISMFPGMRLFARGDWDYNPFLLNHNWFTVGALVSYDLFRYPSLKNTYKAAKLKQELARKSRLAVAMGVLTQVHLAYLQYKTALEQYTLARDLANINQRLLTAGEQARDQGELSDADVLNYQAQSLFADVNAISNYGDIQVALEHLANALGTPLCFLHWDRTRAPQMTLWYHNLQALPKALDPASTPGTIQAPLKNLAAQTTFLPLTMPAKLPSSSGVPL